MVTCFNGEAGAVGDRFESTYGSVPVRYWYVDVNLPCDGLANLERGCARCYCSDEPLAAPRERAWP